MLLDLLNIVLSFLMFNVFSFAYPFLDIAALSDLPYISRSAVRPTLQTLALIQSSTSFSQDLFGLPLFLWPFNFPCSINFSTLSCLVYVLNNLNFCFLIKFNNVDVVLISCMWRHLVTLTTVRRCPAVLTGCSKWLITSP